MHFSLSSVLMSVLFSNIMLIILYFVFRNTDFMIRIGNKLLTLFLAITVLRFLFPLELPISRNILLPEWISRFLIFVKSPLFTIRGFQISIWRILLAVWIAGVIIGVIRLIRSYTEYSRSFLLSSKDVTAQEPYFSTIQKICTERGRKNHFRICLTEEESIPMIHGLLKPIIHIPKNLPLTDRELYYVLSHEAAHYFHGDLWQRLLLKLLRIAYWWNPFVYLLEDSFETLLEMRVDSHIIRSTDGKNSSDYLQCLIDIARSEVVPEDTPEHADWPCYEISSEHNSFSNCMALPEVSGTAEQKKLGFSIKPRDPILVQRFQMMMANPTRKLNWIQILCLVLITGLYTFSMIFIFEPHYMSPDALDDISAPDGEISVAMPDNSYLIVNPSGGYDLYIDGEYMETIPEVDEYLSDIKIYNTIEEVPND